jgi:predicted DCC family thiol-disulfide oxidoreductase YuxK
VPTTLIFYDGVCGLCNRFVTFLLRRDRRATFRFAPLQGDLAREVLVPRGIDPSQLSSIVMVAGWKTSDERTFSRSRAVLEALDLLGSGWRVMAALGRLVPRPLADFAYAVTARYRYHAFGRFEACPIPPPEWRGRFLE